jgi:hypothetical protein
VLYRTTNGDGAKIVDKFKEREKPQGKIQIGAALFHCGLIGDYLKSDPFLPFFVLTERST